MFDDLRQQQQQKKSVLLIFEQTQIYLFDLFGCFFLIFALSAIKSQLCILLLFYCLIYYALSLSIIHNHQKDMRKDEFQIIDNIEKLITKQFYLLEPPKTTQQSFLHLFAHRILVKRGMFSKNIDHIKKTLVGTFANSALNNSILTSLIENNVDLTDEDSHLIEIIQGWISFYPTIRSSGLNQFKICDIALQDNLDISSFKGFYNYLTYLNIISADLWKIIRGKKTEEGFLTQGKNAKTELQEIVAEKCSKKLDANDLLQFVGSCIPKTLLNIILQKDAIPNSLVSKDRKNLECLYSNQALQYFLRTHLKLSLLLKNVLLILITMDLNSAQQRYLLLSALRYYYIYHYHRRYCASQILINVFNKLNEEVKTSLKDQFTLFFKIILKLGKEKFTNFIGTNSKFMKNFIDIAQRKPLIGYSQESVSPYNLLGASDEINIERGATATRYFQILQDYSIFYFRIQAEKFDITVKLYYLGQICSEKEHKTLLFTHEKSEGELKNSVNAIKKGIYMFQFDNSYSWINSKKIFYDIEIFTPLQLRATNADEWLDDFYENIPLNQIADASEIYLFEHKKLQQKEDYLGVLYIQKEKDLYKIRIREDTGEYLYETDNLNRLKERIEEIKKSKNKYRLNVYEQIVDSWAGVQSLLEGREVERKEKIEQKPEDLKKERISIEEYREDGEEPQVEYEVVQRELERSQIIGADTISTNSVSAQSIKSKVEEKETKQTINCSFEETQDLYKNEG